MSSLLRQLAYIAAAAMACLYVLVVLRGPAGVPNMMEKRQQIERMKQENEAIRQEIERKKKHIDHLQASEEERNRTIRERTHKSKDSETVIYLPEGGSTEPAPPQP